MNRPGFKLFRLFLLAAALFACGPDTGGQTAQGPDVPRGYLARLQIEVDDRILSFGPFVGYYFKPASAENLREVDFVCFNEGSFYTRDLPADTRLFEGTGRLRRLPPVEDVADAGERRIVPVFFDQAPHAWLETRPSPRNEYLHFHSAYDGRGAVRYGYWLRHVGLERFTYDMGGRVGKDSPLYHTVEKGPDRRFARIIEFDHGPE